MIKYGNKKIFWLGVALLFLIDLCSKTWALNFLPYDKEVPVNYLFSLHRVFNDSYLMFKFDFFGRVWMLETELQFQIFYISTSILMCVAIVWLTNQPAMKKDSWTAEFCKAGMCFIMSGTLGNVFDRIFRDKGVIDFIRIKDGYSYDLIFNFADLAIYIGEFCILCAWFLIVADLVFNKYFNFNVQKRQSLD